MAERDISNEKNYGWRIGLAGGLTVVLVLGVLGRSRRGSIGVFAVFLLELLDNFIQQIIQEFVGILVLGIAE